MPVTRTLAPKRNLLLAFDAFGTLYQPNLPVPQAYGRAARRHGISCAPEKPEHELTAKDYEPVRHAFTRAFKEESARNPNYGKATGLGAEKWWANVIRRTFHPFLKPSQHVPDNLISELITHYSTGEGYHMYPDVLPFFRMLKNAAMQRAIHPPWKWDKTVVGIITNSDDRVPSILESFGLKVGPRRVGSSAQRSAEATPEDDISFVVLSYDVGFEKPDRRIFDAATQMLQETLAESGQPAERQSVDDYEKLYVGDSLDKDYFGAEAAGWHGVFVDRRKKKKHLLEELRLHPLTKIELKDKGVIKKVDMCADLGALSSWEPHEAQNRE